MREYEMRMVISDHPVQEALMAKAKDHHERATLVGTWFNKGHIIIRKEDQESPAFIALRMEDELFVDPRDRFPTVELIARIQLALHAGRSHTKVDANPTATEIKARMEGVWSHGSVGMGRSYVYEEWADVLETAYANVAQITRDYRDGKGKSETK